jgi:hypothetical protein
MNQQGTPSGDATRKCSSSQNGRGGLSYVFEDKTLADAAGKLIEGETAPTKAPQK